MKEQEKEIEKEAILLTKRLRGRRQARCPTCDLVSLCATIKEKKECPYCGQKLRVPEKN